MEAVQRYLIIKWECGVALRSITREERGLKDGEKVLDVIYDVSLTDKNGCTRIDFRTSTSTKRYCLALVYDGFLQSDSLLATSDCMSG